MTQDQNNLARTAQFVIVEVRRGYGSPASYEPVWRQVWAAKVDPIEINHGAKPSTAVVWFPTLRWDTSFDISWGDRIRIRTAHTRTSQRTILFSGFVTSYRSEFSGGSVTGGSFERTAVTCMDHRWLMHITSPVYGRFARSPDDYNNYGTESQSAIADKCTFMSGQRTVFNESGRPNRDSVDYTSGSLTLPIFAPKKDAVPWTARAMICYLLSKPLNQAYRYLPIDDPSALTGLADESFDRVLNSVSVEGLSIIEAVDLICRQLGFSFREDYSSTDTVNLIFYRVAAASSYTRTSSAPTILQRLYAPAVGENISVAVASGKKMLHQAEIAEDTAAVVNNPWGLGGVHRFEFTAELVPAWQDSDLVPDSADSYSNVYLTEAFLQTQTAKNDYSFFKYYHTMGNSFRRDIGRKWALNESGRYTAGDCDRGMPFDFATVIDPVYIFDSEGRRLFAPFERQLLPCLTFDKDTLNSVGIRVEFSFDGGISWQVIPCSIQSLPSEAGIYIDQPNLSEIVEQSEGSFSSGGLSGKQINFWTSLCDDKINSRSFKDGNWNTRIRVTASVQLDQRLRKQVPPTAATGSPHLHVKLYDFSEKYTFSRREESSVFDATSLPAWNTDESAKLLSHLDAIRSANEDMSISGIFTLDRLWLGDGAGIPSFAVGDCIEEIDGRCYKLSAAVNQTQVHPEIIQIIYLPETQRMRLVTRDLRFAQVLI